MYVTTTKENQARHMETAQGRLLALRRILGYHQSMLTGEAEAQPLSTEKLNERLETHLPIIQRLGLLRTKDGKSLSEKIFEHLTPEEVKVVSENVQRVASRETGTH